MSISRGFECDVFVYSSSAWRRIATLGDIEFTSEKTSIEVANRASNVKRVLSGMESFNISMTVQKGTDPADTGSFDAYSTLKTAYDGDTPLKFNFGGTLLNGTITGGRTEDMLITSFSESAPIDDIYTASVSMGISAKSGAAGPTTDNTPAPTGNDEGSGE